MCCGDGGIGGGLWSPPRFIGGGLAGDRGGGGRLGALGPDDPGLTSGIPTATGKMNVNNNFVCVLKPM